MTAVLKRDAGHSEGAASPFYFNAAHWRAIDGVVAGVKERAGVMLVTGPTGSGKTTLMRAITDQLEDDVVPLFLQYASLNFKEFVNFLHASLKVEHEAPNAPNKAVGLREFLYAQARRNETAVVFIDEAQNLEPDVLRMLPKLARFDELPDGRVVGLQFVLVGGEALREYLGDPDFDAVRAAIDRSFDLRFFTRGELRQFLEKRLAPIARMAGDPITPEAIEAVGRYTGGSPRLTGMICSHAMLFAAENPGKVIDEAMIVEAADALMIEPAKNPFAHEDDTPDEAEGPFSRADLDGRASAPRGARQTEEDDALEASDRQEDAAAFDFDPGFPTVVRGGDPDDDPEQFDDEDDLDHVDDLDDVLDDDDEQHGFGESLDDDDDDDDYDRETERRTLAELGVAGAAAALFAGLKRRLGGARARSAPQSRMLGGARRRQGAKTPRSKRKLRTQVAGAAQRRARIAAVLFGAVIVVGGLYAIREPVARGVGAVTQAAQGLFSDAPKDVAASVEALRGPITVGSNDVDPTSGIPAPAFPAPSPPAAVERVDPAPAPESAAAPQAGGWGAQVTMAGDDGAALASAGTEETGGTRLTAPKPVEDMARGALDAVSSALTTGAMRYEGPMGDALDAAAGSLSALRGRIGDVVPGGERALARAAELVAEGESHLAARRLVRPRSGNAYDSFRAALELDPTNATALERVAELRDIFTKRAESARDAQRWTEANELFETAIAIGKLRPVR